MKQSTSKRPRSGSSTMLSVFVKRHDGIAAVEFGLLLPVLMIMLLGTLEIGLALSVDRRVSMAVASVADLVSQENLPPPSGTASTIVATSTQSLDSILSIAKHLMNPYDATKLKLTIKAIRPVITNPGNGEVQWSYTYNGAAAPKDCSIEPLQKDILSAGNIGISVEGEYLYKPLITKYFIKSDIKFTDNAMLIPRNGNLRLKNSTGTLKATCP